MSAEPAAGAARLERLARGLRGGGARDERCELCIAPLDGSHRHVVDVPARTLLCVCRPCAVLFARAANETERFRAVPERRERLASFVLEDESWRALGVPVGLAFFVRSTPDARVRALYPGALGVTEAEPEAGAWESLVLANPVLAELEPDVEALLVCRAGGAREHWRVGVDVCYALAGVVRRHWRGFTGGDEAWTAIRAFFAEL